MSARESSVIVRGVRAIGRTLRSLDDGLARAAADRNAREDADEARVRAIVADSRLVRMVERLFAAPSLAWQHSRARSITRGAVDTFNALALPERVRLLGWMILVAVGTRAALYVLAGNAPTAATLTAWGAVAAVGLFMMAAAGAVAAAWVDWRRRRS